jgi:hypothetical protein
VNEPVAHIVVEVEKAVAKTGEGARGAMLVGSPPEVSRRADAHRPL